MNAQYIKLAIAAALVLGVSACSKHKSKKGGSPAAGKVAPAAIDQCPKGVEGLWEVNKGSVAASNKEVFAIGRLPDGTMQLTKGDLAESIVLNGKFKLIAATKDGQLTGEGSNLMGKCEDGVIVITEKQIVDKAGTEVDQTGEFRLNAEELMGNLTIKQGGKTLQVEVLQKTNTGTSQVNF